MADGKGYLYISQDSEPLYLAHYLTNYFEKIIVPLSEVVGGDFRDEKEYGQLMVGFLSIKHLEAKHFNLAYRLTLKACQNDKDLARYRGDFERLFQADPRYNAQKTAI